MAKSKRKLKSSRAPKAKKKAHKIKVLKKKAARRPAVKAKKHKAAKKQEGITFFLVDMKSPGVTVRGIKNIAGGTEFCGMLFDQDGLPVTLFDEEPRRITKSQYGYQF